MGMKTTQSRAQCDGYREQTQLKSWIWHIKGCCRSSDINYQHLKAEWTVLTRQIGLMIHDGSYSAICSWTCSTGHLPGAKSGRACSTKKNWWPKKKNGFNIANGCAAMGATGPLLPSVHGNRHADVAARWRPTSGCRGEVVGKSKFQSAGKRGIGGRLDGVAKICFNMYVRFEIQMIEEDSL